MARPSSKDPLDKFRWIVSIDGFTKLGFVSVQTPSYTINTNKYPEGGAHMFPKQIVDSVEYSPVTLTRGVTSDKSFHEWARGPFDILSTNDPTELEQNSESVEVGAFRRNVTITHVDRVGRRVKSYELINAFPVGYKPASDFESQADDGVSIENLTLAYEAFVVRDSEGRERNRFSIRDIGRRLLRRSI